MTMLFPLLILISLFDLEIAMKFNDGIITSIVNENFDQFAKEFVKTAQLLAVIDFVVASAMIASMYILIKRKKIHMIGVIGLLFVVTPIILDLNYRLTHKILNNSSLTLSGIKTRVFLYKYYKAKGDSVGLDVVLKEGLSNLDSNDLYILVKNRKNNKNDLFVLKNKK